MILKSSEDDSDEEEESCYGFITFFFFLGTGFASGISSPEDYQDNSFCSGCF